MSKINELIQTLCPDGVEYKKLGEVGCVRMCKRIMKDQTSSTGDVPFYKIGTFGGTANAYITQELFDEYSSRYNYPKKGNVLISAAGTIGRTVVFDGKPSYFQDSNIVWLEHDGTRVTDEYLKYIYSTSPWYVADGGTISRLYNDNILNAVIPVPPLPVQEEIVRILDEYTELEAELEAKLSEEIELKQKQYAFYRDKLIFSTNGRAAKLLDFLVQPITDGPHTTPVLVDDGVRFISASAIENGRIDFSKQQGFITKEFDLECAKKYKPRKYDVFMVKSGSTTGKVGYADTDEDFNIWSPLAAMRANSYIESRYLYYLLQTEFIQSQVRMKMSHGSQPNLSMRVLEKFDIIIPTIEEQERIVKIFEKLEVKFNDFISALNTELESRKKQYAYYRDQLLTFKRKEV